MKCPVCSNDLEPGAVSCPACHAFQVVERTPLGVFAGWAGVLSAVWTAMILTPVPFKLVGGESVRDFPWILPILGFGLAAACLWYSKSTRHAVWQARNQDR